MKSSTARFEGSLVWNVQGKCIPARLGYHLNNNLEAKVRDRDSDRHRGKKGVFIEFLKFLYELQCGRRLIELEPSKGLGGNAAIGQ